MSILVIGRTGQVARALVRRAGHRGLSIDSACRPELDLAEISRAVALVERLQPDVMINAGGYTAVDNAEDEPERARLINALGAGAVAGAAPGAIVHLSTDYVFSGDKHGPYQEGDPTEPLSVYGATKLEGEQLVLQSNPRAVVIRTSWVFDATGKNFVRTMLRLAKYRDVIDVVSDQHGCPTFADDLADALLGIAQRPTKFGVYHCAGAGETTWADFARHVFSLSRERGGPYATVKGIRSGEFVARARRPANSRLDCEKLAVDYGLRLRPWQEAVGACIDQIASDGWRVE